MALSPDRSLSEYIRERWDAQKEFPGGPIYAIAQTPDGYLWLGAERGLVRFDGLNFQLYEHASTPVLPTGPILGLLTDTEGNLWIRPQSRNLLRYRDGVFQDVVVSKDNMRFGVTAMCLGADGETLFALHSGGIFTYQHGKFSKILSTEDKKNLLIISIAKTGDGKIWIGTSNTGLWMIDGDRLSAAPPGLPDKKVNSLLATGDHKLWVGTDSGVARWNGQNFSPADNNGSPFAHVQALAMSRDRNANVWVGTPRGLLRFNEEGVYTLDEASRQRADSVNAVFEDREGNFWVGSMGGVERLRDSVFITYPATSDPFTAESGTVYADSDGRVWFAPASGGLFWRQEGQAGQVKDDGLSADVVYSLTGSEGELWMGRRSGRLTRLKYGDGSYEVQTYTNAQGLPPNPIYSVYQSRDGAVWAGTQGGGLVKFKDGKFTRYTMSEGLSSNTITSIAEVADGTMFFGTSSGVSSLAPDGKWTSYGGAEGLPPGGVNCLAKDSDGALWIGTDNGLAFYRSGQIHFSAVTPAPLREPVRGVAEDLFGGLWVSTSNHVLRVDRLMMLDGHVGEADVREFGLSDGLRSTDGVRRDRSVIADARGRVWVATYRGFSVVDPENALEGFAPSLVHIETVQADGLTVDSREPIRLSSSHQRLTFDYAGLSLSVPERVRFRYRLDGFDHDWSPPVETRQAVYTNLGPGTYRFRVMASNSAGLWNSGESAQEFEIEPAFWQTSSFRILTVVVVVLAILALYQLRLSQLTKQLNVRFEERLAERTRIAQDLHDTLLQGYLSASMQLHIAANYLPPDSAAKPIVNRVLELMERVNQEGRTTLRGLRASGGESFDLAQSFSVLQQEVTSREGIDFRVTMAGRPRPVRPAIGDEIYRIGREAVTNAFRHSGAKKIAIEIDHSENHLRLLVRDDGRGIDQMVLRDGREGHWGLVGMSERAKRIGGRLHLRSQVGNGTEVELTVPGHVAYQHEFTGGLANRFVQLFQTKKRITVNGKETSSERVEEEADSLSSLE